jgi:hypothetical protein
MHALLIEARSPIREREQDDSQPLQLLTRQKQITTRHNEKMFRCHGLGPIIELRMHTAIAVNVLISQIPPSRRPRPDQESTQTPIKQNTCVSIENHRPFTLLSTSAKDSSIDSRIPLP